MGIYIYLVYISHIQCIRSLKLICGYRCAFCMGKSVAPPTFFRRSIGDPVQLLPTPIGDPVQLFRDPPSCTPKTEDRLIFRATQKTRLYTRDGMLGDGSEIGDLGYKRAGYPR